MYVYASMGRGIAVICGNLSMSVCDAQICLGGGGGGSRATQLMKLKRIGNAFHCGLFSFYPSLVRFGFMQFMASAKVLRPTVSPLIYARGMEV